VAKRFTVAVDLDGVVADFTTAARNILKLLFNGRPDDKEVQLGWGFDSLGITDEEENRMWDIINATPNWWMYLKTMPNSDMLPQLCAEHKVIFVTNRKAETVGLPTELQSSLWLINKFGLQVPTVLLSSSKGPLLKELGVDYFCDDKPKNVESALAHHPNCNTYLINGTYNQEFENEKAPRVYNFNEFAKGVLNAGRS
jgi:uncharacterized HAD superfamily protein